MAFLRLCSYLYGMFLLKHPLDSAHRSLQDSIKRMLNAFQSMLSFLMSTRKHDTQLIRNRVKLFMSTAHFCEDAIPAKESSNEKTKTLKPVDMLTNDEVMFILHSFHVTSGNRGTPRSTLDGITRGSLVKQLKQRNLPSTGKNKSDLQIRLFNAMLCRQIRNPELTAEKGSRLVVVEESQISKKSKTPSLVWDKGAWLSFVTNIAWQIDLLGPLIWIW